MDPDKGSASLHRPPRLLDQARDKLRTLHYSYRTEQQYLQWIRRFILLHGKRHPRTMGAPEVEAFLTNLAVVLSHREVRAVLARLENEYWLIASILYGGGLRLQEALQLRVKDVDFDLRQFIIRSGKGGKDRVTILPEAVVEPLQRRLSGAGSTCSRRRQPRTIRAATPCAGITCLRTPCNAT